MTLLTLFNNELKNLPAISENLRDLIMMKGWSEEKSEQAVSIVQQIGKGDVIEKCLCLSYGYVRLSHLEISLFPNECGIDNATFDSNNIFQGDKYIKDLLADINCMSADVKFSFEGHCYENDVCIFYISWEF